MPAVTPSVLTRPTTSARRLESCRKRGPVVVWRVWRFSGSGIGSTARMADAACGARAGSSSGHGDEPLDPLGGHVERLGARSEHTVAALQLGAVDGEVGLVDERVRVLRVLRIGGDADRDGRADRLARGLDVEAPVGDGAADALGDLERLLRRRLGEQDAELLAAEPRRHVVVAQLGAEDVGDALQHGVAGEVAVGVVDLAEQVEVGHDQRHRPLEALRAAELLRQRRREVACVEEARSSGRRAPRPAAVAPTAPGE